jgi:hypothetical protein
MVLLAGALEAVDSLVEQCDMMLEKQKFGV